MNHICLWVLGPNVGPKLHNAVFLVRWIFGPSLGPNIFPDACSMFAVQFEIPLCAIGNLMSCDESYMLIWALGPNVGPKLHNALDFRTHPGSQHFFQRLFDVCCAV